MGKTLKYVSEFSFPPDKGYSGSAGQQMVKGYARGGSCNMAKGGMKPMKKADGGMVDDPRRPMMDRTLAQFIEAINNERGMDDAAMKEKIDRFRQKNPGALSGMSNVDRMALQRAIMRQIPSGVSQGLRSPTAEMARERALLGENAGYKKGGMAKGGKMDGLKGVIGNERSEMARVEAKQRDAGQELSRVRSEMRYDKNEMKGMRKQYPTNRSEPMIAMAKGGMAPKADMLFSKKEVNATNLLRDGKGAPMPHPKGSVNMKHGGMAHDGMAKGGMTSKQQAKVGKVMDEFKAGKLHSGSKSGPVVKSRKQAIAIGIAEARKAKK